MFYSGVQLTLPGAQQASLAGKKRRNKNDNISYNSVDIVEM
jgi:hypothetical protein